MNKSRIKNLFFTLSTVIAGTISAQPTIVSSTDTIFAALDTISLSEQEIVLHWDLENNTSSALELMCTRNFVDVVSPYNYPYAYDSDAGEPFEGSYEKFCWGPICYGYGADASSLNASFLVQLSPGETNDTFVAYFYANDVLGTSTIEYCFHPVGNQSVGSCKSITYVVTATAVSDVEMASPEEVVFTSVYPNPLCGDGFVNYELNAGDVGEVVFRDLMGRDVKREVGLFSKGKLQVTATDFPQGIGFCTLEINGVAVRTERFVVVR